MRTSRLLLILVAAVCFCWPQQSSAVAVADTLDLINEDSVHMKGLIISEIQLANREIESWVYAEFANVSDITLDLSRYFTWSTYHNNVWADENTRGHNRRIDLEGELAPGETYVVVRREHNWQTDPWGNLLYPNGYGNPEAEAIADLIRSRQDPIADEETYGARSAWAEWRIGLAYINQITAYDTLVYPDSVFIDRFGVSKDDYPEGNIDNQDAYRFPIAGLATNYPRNAAVYVRKTTVKSGNTWQGEPNDYPTKEWNDSRGTDLSDSEWIPLPRSMDKGFDKIFTTIGYHGPNPDLEITSSLASIDFDNKIITLPYGTSRDSVFRLFETGMNHAWSITLGADTAQFFVQEDDMLSFYTVGETLMQYDFTVALSGSKEKMAQVAPRVYRNANGDYVRNFDISQGHSPMDTIGTLIYDYPVDTLFSYLVKEEGATWKIKPKDGVTRPELKDGDILEVTSKDGSTVKEYYLGVQDFYPNHNANLASIYFPGLEIFENPETFEITDSLINFAPGVLYYSVKLPLDIVSSPPIIAQPASNRSKVVVKRATDLKGSLDARTATITVTAEDDTTILEYKIAFSQERPAPPIQGSLFISDLATQWGANNQYNIQLFNPSDEFLDLTDYAFITWPNSGWDNMISSFTNDSNWLNNNKYVLRFGFIIENSADGGTPVYTTDLLQKTVLLANQEVYSMAKVGAFPMLYGPDNLRDKIDLVIGHGNEPTNKAAWWANGWLDWAQRTYGTTDRYGSGYLPLQGFTPKMQDWGRQWFGIAKILNDSVKDGTKHVMGNFDSDYEWVDVFQGPSLAGQPVIIYDNDTLIDMGNKNNQTGLVRKSHIYKGNPIEGLSFGIGDPETLETIYPSEWDMYGFDLITGAALPNDHPLSCNKMKDQLFESHTLLSFAHIPYLTSGVYLMDEGLDGPQNIYGVTSGTTVEQFLGNVNKADTGMTIKVLGAGNVEMSGSELIAAGTNVWSKSANGADSVNYVITNLGALDSDCALTSPVYTVTKDGATGTISGVAIGTTLESILAKVDYPATAILNVTDGGDQNLPIYKYNADTVKQQNYEKTASLASTMTYLEVIAQDKVSKCIYAIEFDEVATPFILSDVYVVDETSKIIDFVGRTSPEVFLSRLVASPGATMKVVNRLGQERKLSTMEYTDKVVVTKGNMSVTYLLNFTTQDGVIVKVKEAKRTPAMSIYPNPTRDFVNISGISGKFIEVRDLAGKVISKQAVTSSTSTIDMRNLSSGIYIISSENVSYKVIKE